MPMPRKIVNVDWSIVLNGLTSGSITKIEHFASMYNISRPTAKKMLAEKYGSSIVFTRGRSGGIVFDPSMAGNLGNLPKELFLKNFS
jgi:hypothetical protein